MGIVKMGMKGQSDVISVLLIVAISIGLVATAYSWGVPLIQKQQDTSVSTRVFSYYDENNVNSVVKKIENVAKNGGSDTFSSDVKGGIWILNSCVDAADSSCLQTPYYNFENNSLEFSFFSRVSQYSVGTGWITVSSSDPCPSPASTIGQDSYVVCVKSDKNLNGYNVTYKVQFRELDDVTNTDGYKIVLLPQILNLNTSTSGSIQISRGNVITTTDSSGKTLIITEVNILLG